MRTFYGNEPKKGIKIGTLELASRRWFVYVIPVQSFLHRNGWAMVKVVIDGTNSTKANYWLSYNLYKRRFQDNVSLIEFRRNFSRKSGKIAEIVLDYFRGQI